MAEALLKGLVLGLLLALSVGPVIFTVIKQSINNGQKGGFSFVGGVWLSDIILVVLANAFSQLVAELLNYKTTIAYLGVTFLLGLGVYYLFFKKAQLNTDSDGNPQRFGRMRFAQLFVSGFLINTLNPSVFIFWLSNATIFSVNTVQQRILIFTTCLLINFIADTGKVVAANSLRARLTLRSISIINKVSGSLLIFFAFALFYAITFLSEKVD